MKTRTIVTTYIVYKMPGMLCTEEFVMVVGTRDPKRDATNAPAGAFAFFYFDIVNAMVEVDGEYINTKSDRRNVSKTIYLEATVLSYEEVEALPGNHEILLGNMRINGYSHVVRCNTGNFQPFNPELHAVLRNS
ncbi:MAG: hypothetical protein WAQ25_02835 [Candidatus Saccharimonas sp.]